MNSSAFLRDLIVLVPLVAAQVGISRVVRRWWVTVLAVVSSLVGLAADLWTLGLHIPGIDAAGALAFIWMMACFPAYLIYLCLRPWRDAKPASESRRTALKAAVAAPFAAMGYGVAIGRLDFHVREVSLPVAGLHPDLEGLRILHLSDVHMGKFLSEREFERVVDMANGLHPQLAIMTGDLISRPGDPMEECVRQLARVKADAGMYGCLGNHEMYSKVEAQVKAEGARRGIEFLRHENRKLRFGKAVMNLGGVDYQRSDRKDYLRGAEMLLDRGALNVMLSHNPDVFPVAAKQGWDLTLAGHTHGGQVTFEIVEQYANITRFFTRYVAGEYHLGNAGCYVTRGIGTVGLPARVGVPPEITLLKLRKA